MINIEEMINDKFPKIKDQTGGKFFFKLLKSLTHEDEINAFIETHQHLSGFAFLEQILDYFNFSYRVNNRSFNRIPAEGRVIIVANHPIGSLDGLALLKLVKTVRADVRIVANDLLIQVKPLQSLFLPVDNLSDKNLKKRQYKAMLDCLNNEQAIIIFPAGEVSRISAKGIKDGRWKQGFVKLAVKTNSPILPILIDAKNSAMFYSLSAVYKPLGTMMLIHEMFNKENKEINFHISKVVDINSVKSMNLGYKVLAQRFRKYLYQLNKNSKKNKKPLFSTFETVKHPVSRQALKYALYASKKLGETNDGKVIFLCEYSHGSAVMQEIGRLRELTFRSIEEGTGMSADLDIYDSYYRHIVLWDEKDLEIVGAYRLGECDNIVSKYGIEGLYTHSLFKLDSSFENYFSTAIELGRSFVQPRYWGGRSLDYLWYGIGAYLRDNPQIKYLFGPVSLSNAYPDEAKQLILSFYKQQLGQLQSLAKARHPYHFDPSLQNYFNDPYKQAFAKLNKLLEAYDVKVPVLYKQYADLCNDNGCHFIDFSIDPDFNNCIDSLILVDLAQLKEKKYTRYINNQLKQ
ncbi:MAG: GNAT family N-acyltransferase [Pseudomonadota bacterium]